MDDKSVEYLFKVILIGDSNVGKTNLLSRFCEGKFLEDTRPTIGIDHLTYDTTIDQKQISVHFWDTAGQEKYRGLTAAYYKNVHGVVIVYDITARRSYDNVENWLQQMRELVSNDVCVLLIGNKLDLEEKRQVPKDEAQEFAKNEKMFFFETSAKTNPQGTIEAAFTSVINELCKMYSEIDKQPEMKKKLSLKNSTRSALQNSLGMKVDPVTGEPRQKRFCC